jgi:5-methylcytosine-specific restriction endonuclease McrA
MAHRAKHPCNAPCCPVLVPAGQSLCADHQRERDHYYNHVQRPARHRFYQTKEWRELGRQVLWEEPLCPCGAKATQADHIISVKERPDLALARSNLVGRCASCHSRKTAIKDGRWKARA